MAAVRSSDPLRGTRRTAVENSPPGAFLHGIDHFDSSFFGMAPLDAAITDPQRRLALELGWEALEDAGVVIDRVKDGETGVFLGAVREDYADVLRAQGVEPPPETDRHTIADTVAAFLGTSGPSLAVDAAQVSALAAVHAAGESLRRGSACSPSPVACGCASGGMKTGPTT
ncbi:MULTISPECIES: beta-ketoacyl synthase N-terminal-like domain-containing protein [Streptomyces]|uniref:Beta-ketoacyl synthase N-terminal-like domain-containing protein n=1 Tax=Streptomyces lonegramiae TaxID=3075524 RepID=A0ABU2XWN7_9ACTN|nr:beta-ketoacyl synthase N-terminal-like domain-containing protein [Streptomyces sp. DSM 41529]MDT0550227.1 beta-ketoacyl synthase N-terminal-like domain-containing protein [Streptomyces sp. DSM 41529]